MSVVSYDLSIISEKEASERLGVIAAGWEDHHIEGAGEDIRAGVSPDLAYAYARNAASRTLDVLALRKAQVALLERTEMLRQIFQLRGLVARLQQAELSRTGRRDGL